MGRYNAKLNLEERNSLSLLINRIAPKSSVLEFGPAHGRMSKYLKETLDCSVFAVEIDVNSANDARKYCDKVIVGDIEEYDWVQTYVGMKFDYIVFADVLEHLYNPKKALLESKNFLKEDGCILVSIPNISHNAVIMELIKNRFTYRPTGLLDDTHIRFFTKHSFEELIKECGLHCSYKSAVYARPDITEFEHRYDLLPESIGKYLRDREFGEAYQLIYELKTQIVDKTVEDYAPRRIGTARLFVDNGNGFCEENSMSIDNPQSKDELSFDISRFDSVTAIRLDPLDMKCILKIERAELELKDGVREELNFTPVNAILTANNWDYFAVSTPSYEARLQMPALSAEKVIITIKYFQTGDDVSDLIHSAFISKIADLEAELSNIKNSKSWKITRPIRYLRRLFEK